MDFAGTIVGVIVVYAFYSPKGTGRWAAEAVKAYRAAMDRED